MSLNWSWYDKMGELTYQDKFTANIYQGNALMIAVAENENTYQLVWFAADKHHLKNMLGLTKGYEDNKLSDYSINKLKLNVNYKSVPEIVSLIAKSKAEVTIELYKGE